MTTVARLVGYGKKSQFIAKVRRHSYCGTCIGLLFGMLVHLTRNLIQVCRAGRSRVTLAVVPRSSCRIDIKGALLYHDPLQLPNPEDDPIYGSLDTRRCLVAMKAIVEGTLYSSIVLIALLFVLQLRTKLDAINTRIVQYGHLRDINRELVVNFSFTACAIIRISLLKTSVPEYNGVIIRPLRMQLRVRY